MAKWVNYEAYRYSKFFKKDRAIAVVSAPNEEEARGYLTIVLDKIYNDQKPFDVRLKV
jgi:hypothetical protein